MARKRKNFPTHSRRLSNVAASLQPAAPSVAVSRQLHTHPTISGICDIATNLQSLSEEDAKAAEIYMKAAERIAHEELINQIDEDEWNP